MMDYHEEAGEGQLTQMYFFGGHGGIGGGDSRQINPAACTLRFLVEEMEKRELGLAINKDMIPDYMDVVEDGEEIKSSAVMSFVEKVTGKFVRSIPSIDMVHPSAIERYQKNEGWRPEALENLKDALLSFML